MTSHRTYSDPLPSVRPGFALKVQPGHRTFSNPTRARVGFIASTAPAQESSDA